MHILWEFIGSILSNLLHLHFYKLVQSCTSIFALVCVGINHQKGGDWKGNRLTPFPNWFWWLNWPTQIIGLTSLLYIMSSTGAKGSQQTNKKTEKGFKYREQKSAEMSPGLAHRTVRCATGLCPVHQGVRLQTCHLWEFWEPLRYNSPDCPV